MNKSLQMVLSLVVGLAAFVFFVLLFFPLDAVVGHYVGDLESQTKGAYRLSYSKMEPSLVFESVFYDLTVEQKVKDAYKEIFFAPKIKLSISLFSLLSQTVNTRFSASLKEGSLSGHIELSKQTSLFDLEFKRVNLDEVGILKTYLKTSSFSVTPIGNVSGEVYLSLGKTLEQTEADFRFKVSDFQLKNFDIPQLGGSVVVPDLTLSPKDGTATLEGNLNDGHLTLTNLNFPGSDVQMELKGRVDLDKDFGVSRSNLRGRFTFSDSVFEKVPALEIIKSYKTADGFFPLTLGGTGKKPQIRIGSLNLSEMLNL